VYSLANLAGGCHQMSLDPESFREHVRKDWTDGVAAWRKWNPELVTQSRRATAAIVEASGAGPGMKVLDLASGTGEPSLTLAEVVGDSGRVVATDLVPGMLDVINDHVDRLEISNLSCEQADPEDLQFADESFDVVTCRFGVMFFPDVGKAMREIHRVLKPGGRTSFVVFGPAENNTYFDSTSGIARRRAKMSPPEHGAPTPFRFAQNGSLTEALLGGGFREVEENLETIPWVFEGDTKRCWEFISELTGPAFKQIFDAIPAETEDDVIQEIQDAIDKYRKGDCIDFTAQIIVATGVK
jgi:ubiquinone/menaquinone biosynthesis C-methylase UbiE